MMANFIMAIFALQLALLEAFPMPTRPCDPTQCLLPNCRCASTATPGNLNLSSIPQIVAISFDDAFRRLDYQLFYSQVFEGRTNPNGCKIGLTFFNSHQHTDYALVEHVNRINGWEFASHSVSHRTPTTFWTGATEQQLTEEIVGQQTILNTFGGIADGQVKGYRAPFLATSENELKVLHSNNFTYEASMPTTVNYWPFTLDFQSPLCNAPATCPANSYPGLWLIPNRVFRQSNGFNCGMLDACTAPITEDDWFNFLMDNFNIHYNDNKSPFGIYSHATWFFFGPARVNAMKRFLDTLATMDDVYLVTHSQVIDWVRNPTPLSQIQSFTPWQCPTRPAPRCNFTTPTCQRFYQQNGFFQLASCTAPCPPNYPTPGNPTGQ